MMEGGVRLAACGLRRVVTGQNNGLKIAKGKQQPKANSRKLTAKSQQLHQTSTSSRIFNYLCNYNIITS
jgi:hypothetical protein